MEQVTLQALKMTQLSRSRGNAVTTEEASGDGFMQLIDSMLQNITDGNSDLTGLFGNKDESEVETDGTLLSMLAELLQSGNGNLSSDILELFQNLSGMDGIDEIEIPNMVSKLQQANFFEALGADEETADTLYALGNNTYDYFNAQIDAIKNYVTSRVETGDFAEANLSNGASPMVFGTMADATRVRNESTNNLTELPITSMTYEKTELATDGTPITVQPASGITVPNMISQRVIKADADALAQLSGDEGNDDQPNFESALNEIATSTVSANAQQTQVELPKVQNLSNPLFNEFQINEQITDGIKASLNLEKTEFTVKLNPESLGELTLKLVQEDGKMVLDIVAATESTAKLINGDLAALRESVGLMNLEIREVTVQPPENVEQNSAQFNMTGQQFSDQQRAFANQQQADKPYYAASAGDFITETEVPDYAGRVRTVVDGLDTYV